MMFQIRASFFEWWFLISTFNVGLVLFCLVYKAALMGNLFSRFKATILLQYLSNKLPICASLLP